MRNVKTKTATKKIGNTNELHAAGLQAMRRGDIKQAFIFFGNAHKIDPKNEIHATNFGKTAFRLGQYQHAFDAFYTLHKKSAHLSLLAKSLSALRIEKFDLKIKTALLACLNSDKIEHQPLTKTWYTLLKKDKRHAFLFDKNPVSLKTSDPFILLGLTKLCTATPEMELWLTNLRKKVFFALQDGNKDALDLACSLAQHCFLNEYVFFKSDDENVENMKPASPALYAAYAMYKPLSTLPSPPQDKALDALIKQQIKEPEIEQKLKDDIPAIDGQARKISSAVRTMYEENPYPRWQNINALSAPIIAPDASYLIAGCGTGRSSCQSAKILPETNITAMDLSLTSLAYAKRKATDLGCKNISFIQGDILDIKKLNKRFDVIECSGVLHHMEDPIAGWKSLLSALAEGGYMNIGLYSKKARTHITAAQHYAKEQGYKDIRAFRSDILSMDADNPLKSLLKHNDFYTLSNCRDLIFHLQEQCYTLSELREILGIIDLECVCLTPANPAIASLYRSKYRSDPQMKNLKNWENLEETHPEICVGMYQLWCKKKGNPENDRITLLRNHKFFSA